MSKRTWLSIIGVVVAAVVAAVVVVAALDRHSGGDAPEMAPSAESAPPEPSETTVPESEGELVADAMGRQVLDVGQKPGVPVEQTSPPGGFPTATEPVGPPSGLELQRGSRGVTVVVSSSDGPTGTENGVLTGFARSARGAALLAMAHRGLVIAGGTEYTEFLDYYFPDGLAQLSPEMVTAIENKDAPRMRDYMATGYVAPSWVKVRDCDPAFCTVETANTPLKEVLGRVPEQATNADQHSVTRVSMAWRDNHWMLVKTDAYNVPELDDSWERWL